MSKLVKSLFLANRITLQEFRFELNNKLANFRVFLVCIVLGIFSITSVGMVNSSLISGLKENGKILLGGDLDVRLIHRPASLEQKNFLKINTSKFSEITKMRAMAKPKLGLRGRTLVELKAVDNIYPLVGKLELRPQAPLHSTISKLNGTWGTAVDPNLLLRLGLKIGESLTIGSTTFQIRSTIISEPDRVANMFSFGPRVLISKKALDETGLIRPGSQIHYHYRGLISSNLSAQTLKQKLLEKFPEAGWKISTPEESAEGLKQFITRMASFFSFIGLTVLLIGGLGITGAIRSYLNSKITTIAIIKSLGGNSGLLFQIYILKVLFIGSIAIISGVILGTALPLGCLHLFQNQLPVAPVVSLFLKPIIIASVFGYLGILTFTIWPIAQACQIKPGSLFRSKTLSSHKGPNRKYQLLFYLSALSLGLFCILTSNDKLFSLFFVLGTIVTLLIFRLGAFILLKLVHQIHNPTNLILKIVQSNLRRKNTELPNIVVSMGLGLSLIVAIALIERNLSYKLSHQLPEQAPSFFFMDIQPDQITKFDRAILAIPETSGYQRVPTLRGRIVKINGVTVEKAKIAPGSKWAVRGDRALTYKSHKSDNSTVVAGKWWPKGYTGPPLISLDAKLAKDFNVTVGDTLTINILGRNIIARIKNLRKIDWQTLRFDFAIIFAPGVLEKAPLTYLAAIKAPRTTENALIETATSQFPNISVISVRDALEASAKILAGIGISIKSSATLTLIMGMIVLSGIIASEHHQRIYDAVIFKVLGTTRLRILTVYLLEYGLSGMLTGCLAAIIGSTVGYGVIKYFIKTTWIFSINTVISIIFLSILMVIISGLISTWNILGQSSSAFLRNE